MFPTRRCRHRRGHPGRDLPPRPGRALPGHLPDPRPRGTTIGALPYVLAERPVPVYGTPLTLGFVRERREHGLSVTSPPTVRAVPGRTVHGRALRDDALDPGRRIRTPVGTVVTPATSSSTRNAVDGRLPDHRAARRAGRRGRGAPLLRLDQRRAYGHHAFGRTVGGELEAIFRRTAGRVLVTTFSRTSTACQQVIDLGGPFGRKVALVGGAWSCTWAWRASRSAARPRGDARRPRPGARPPARQSRSSPPAASEAASALVRIAMDDHKLVRVEAGRRGRPLLAHHPGQRARHLEL